MKSFKRGKMAIGVIAAMSFVVACGGDDGDDPPSSSGGGSTTEGVEATGDPVKIGFIGEGQSASIDETPTMQVAEASVDYVNASLDGLAGHPIELVTCETKADAALAADCGATMVEEEVAAVLMTTSSVAVSFIPVLQEAGIPLVAWTATDEEFVSDDQYSFAMGNAFSAFVFPAKLAQELDKESVAVVALDVPGVIGPLTEFGPGIFENADATLDIVPVAAGTADMSPQIQSALGDEPEIMFLFGNPQFCTSALQALRAASYDGTIGMVSNCLDSSLSTAIGDGLEGVYVSYSATEDPTDPDYETLVQLVEDAGLSDEVELSGSPPTAFAVVMSLVRATGDLEGEVTPESITAAMKGAEAQPLPLGGGVEFQCDGTRIPSSPAACSAGLIYSQLDADGEPTEFHGLEGADLLAPA